METRELNLDEMEQVSGGGKSSQRPERRRWINLLKDPRPDSEVVCRLAPEMEIEMTDMRLFGPDRESYILVRHSVREGWVLASDLGR